MNIGVVIVSLLGILVLIVKWGLIIWGIIWMVRYVKRNKEEQLRLRLEVGKLADEVQQLRQELSDGPEKKGSE